MLSFWTVVRIREGQYPETYEVYSTSEQAKAERVCRWLNRQKEDESFYYAVL